MLQQFAGNVPNAKLLGWYEFEQQWLRRSGFLNILIFGFLGMMDYGLPLVFSFLALVGLPFIAADWSLGLGVAYAVAIIIVSTAIAFVVSARLFTPHLPWEPS